MPEECFKIGGRLRNFRSGFTLVEILLVIALIALVMGIAIYQMDGANKDEKPLKHWVWDAIFEARLLALETKQEAVLYYDEKERAFNIKALESLVQTIAIPPNHQGDFTVNFYPLLSDDHDGTFEPDYAEEPIEEIVFYSSGVSMPVRIDIKKAGGKTLSLLPDAFASYFNEDAND